RTRSLRWSSVSRRTRGDVDRRRFQEAFLTVELRLTAKRRELVLSGHPKRLGRARLHTEAAEDAAEHVDLVHLRIPLALRDAMRFGVLTRDNSNAVGRTRGRAERSPNA